MLVLVILIVEVGLLSATTFSPSRVHTRQMCAYVCFSVTDAKTLPKCSTSWHTNWVHHDDSLL